MNDQTKQAMQMALEALEDLTTPVRGCRQQILRTQAAIREALAQPQGKPVAWQDPNSGEVCRAEWLTKHARERDQDRFCVPLYTTPPSVESPKYGRAGNFGD